MQRLVRWIALTIVACGLAGCGGGLREGPPSRDVGYVPPGPDDFVEKLPPQGRGR
jgi:hypothetical protein